MARDYSHMFERMPYLTPWTGNGRHTINFVYCHSPRYFDAGKLHHADMLIKAIKKQPGIEEKLYRGYWNPDREELVIYTANHMGSAIREPSRGEIDRICDCLNILRPKNIRIIECKKDTKKSYSD